LTYTAASQFVGHTFIVQGVLGYHITTSGAVKYQILPRFSTDLVLVG